jgi:hypothetical protein
MDALASEKHTRTSASRTGMWRLNERLATIAVATVTLALGLYLTIWALSGPIEVRPMPSNPSQTSASEGLKVLSSPERQALRARETDALRRNPLDGQALKNLSNLWRADDDLERAERLAVLAGNRSLRDLVAQAEVLDILLRRKDFAASLYRLDALMRAQPDRLPDLLKIAALFAETEESRPALVAELEKNPPWRQALLSAVLKGPNGPAVAYGVLSDMRKSGGAPALQELRDLISTLVDKKDFDTAYFVWLDFLSQPELRKAGNIFDGGFELEPKNLLFGWNIGKLRNADIRLVPRSTSSADRMLRLEFINTRDRFQHVSQLLRLAPGHYTLTGETKAERLVTEVGLVWRFYCLGANVRPIASTARLFASSTWAPFDVPFEIPTEDCAAQKLQLEVDSRASLDQLISGQVYFDNLQIRQGR